jgi:MoaA/NifB/PqqE/SkfB family radical SAM enzyme
LFFARIRRWIWTGERDSQTCSTIPLFQRCVIELQSHCNRDCFFCCRLSDRTGKRKTAAGDSVRQSMPTEKVIGILDELEAMDFKGYITFHHLSEAFLDTRLIEVATEAKRRGMRPYIHTNGDVLRVNEALCKRTADVFEYVVLGLYDYNNKEEKAAEKEFWKTRLGGTQLMFSLVENAYRRTHSSDGPEMAAIPKMTFPTAVCANPQKLLLIHYNGDVCCCCEDMHGELLKVNIFEKSIREIWYSIEHQQLIKDLQAGERGKYDLCSRCTMGPNNYSEDPMLDTVHFDT